MRRSESIDDYRKLIECLKASGIAAGISVHIESCSPEWIYQEIQLRRLPITLQAIQSILVDPINIDLKPYHWRTP